MRRFVHRQLWQRLPHRLRRALLFHSTALAAPRPTVDARPSGPIIVVGALRTSSGLGESARLCHDTLEASGLPVVGIDLTTALMQPLDYPDFAFTDGRAVEGAGSIILHVNSPLVPLAMLRLGRLVVREKRIIGYWAWELPAVPADWSHGIPFVHEIWAPSNFSANAISPIADGRPVRVLAHPVSLNGAGPPSFHRAADHPFTVLTIFNMASSLARKNPLAAIAAFRRAFGSDPAAQLIIKTANTSAFPQGLTLMTDIARAAENIVIITDTINAGGLARLYASADVVMSLHRSEGFGLTLAEAMIRGLPVVGTNWSGNVDFLTQETGMPISYKLIAAEDEQATYHYPGMMWADADVDEAAAALLRLRADPELRRRLGQSAARFAAVAWSRDGYAGAVRQYLGL